MTKPKPSKSKKSLTDDFDIPESQKARRFKRRDMDPNLDDMEESLFAETLKMHSKGNDGWQLAYDPVVVVGAEENINDGMVGMVETLESYDQNALEKLLGKKIVDLGVTQPEAAPSKNKKKSKKRKRALEGSDDQPVPEKQDAMEDEESAPPKDDKKIITAQGKNKKQKLKDASETTNKAQKPAPGTVEVDKETGVRYVYTRKGTRMPEEAYNKLMAKVDKRKQKKQEQKAKKKEKGTDKDKSVVASKKDTSKQTAVATKEGSTAPSKKDRQATRVLGSSASIKEQINSAKNEDEEDSTVSATTAITAQNVTDEELTPDQIRANWKGIGLPDAVMEHIIRIGFKQPTEVQKRGIPMAIERKNLVVASQTGSGKTLVFGLPIITQLLNESNPIRKKLRALIIVPSRELCVQVFNMLKEVSLDTGVYCEMAVGGFYVEKNLKRINKTRPEILVCTPARLWALIHTHRMQHLMEIDDLSYLVFDEADIMVKNGHYQELQHILMHITQLEDNHRVQKMITSATMTLPSRWSHERANVVDPRDDWEKDAENDQLSLRKLMDMMQFDKDDTEVLDLTPATAIADTLIDTQLSCLSAQKQAYLYYFLHFYKGRTIIFCNSIYTVQETFQLMRLLNVRVFQLHGGMDESQRLESLEKFLKFKDAALVATDAVARGIDIPLVSQVIHYDLPTSADTYIHRCGRSGRAFNTGFSIAFVTEKEKRSYKIICGATKRPEGLPLFPVKDNFLQDIEPRVRIGWQMVLREKERLKKSHEVNWYKTMADEMDILLDEEEFSDIFVKEKELKEDSQYRALEHQLQLELKKTVGASRFEGQRDFITTETTDFNFLKPRSRDARQDFLSMYQALHKIEQQETKAPDESKREKKPRRKNKKGGKKAAAAGQEE